MGPRLTETDVTVALDPESLKVAAAVAFLASDMAGFIAGTVLEVNGGYLMDQHSARLSRSNSL